MKRWQPVLDWLAALEDVLPAQPLLELPPETDPDFWSRAAKLEMATRDNVDAILDGLITRRALPASPTALECWFCRKRGEWAAQLVLAFVQQNQTTDEPLTTVLRRLLIDSWRTDGCLAFWNHAIERGGKPHPSNPDGLRPLP
jgi:hypothetical protein